MGVQVEKSGSVCTVIIDRPEVRNAIDGPTGEMLFDAFRQFDADGTVRVAVLWGKGGTFCAGADLKAVASGDITRVNRMNEDMNMCAPLGPTRLHLSKPVIAAVEGHAVAGGLELALWCDMRVAAEDAVFGVFERRFGVPLIDGGTQRLPRLIGMSRALDMILTGRAVPADEALTFGLANRVVPSGAALAEAQAIAEQLAGFPQNCMLGDRKALYRGLDMEFDRALEEEFRIGMEVIASGETAAGAAGFTSGEGRHGEFG